MTTFQVYSGASWACDEFNADGLYALIGRFAAADEDGDEGRLQVWGRSRLQLDQLHALRHNLLPGFEVVGALGDISDAAQSRLSEHATDCRLPAFVCGTGVDDDCEPGQAIWQAYQWTDLITNGPVDVQGIESIGLNQLAADTVLLALQLNQDVTITLDAGDKITSDAFSGAVGQAFDRLSTHWLRTEALQFTVGCSESFQSVQSPDDDDDLESSSEDNAVTLEDLYWQTDEHLTGNVKKRSTTKTLNFQQNKLDVRFFERLSGQRLSEKLFNCAPIVQTERRAQRAICVPLQLRVLAVAAVDADYPTVRRLLRLALQRALALCQRSLLHNTQLATGQLHVPNVHAFQPLPSAPYLCQFALPHGADEDQELANLKQLHDTFCLGSDRPLLRAGNTFRLQLDYLDGYLRNVHSHVKLTAERGTLHLVAGTYTYHHYMQDGMDDSGWGCAYRSLQTICSWFRYQGYTDKAVPTHKQIQQALVDIGDREPKFVGSRQWIGSLEVSYVLDHLLGVEAQIVTAQTGADMPDKARQLQIHFDTHGTPVMIGGGVLAHTILGVDFNEDTGDVQWLILDPHYSDPVDDIKTIIKNGWCGWKQASFWRNDTFYNMCLPRAPRRI